MMIRALENTPYIQAAVAQSVTQPAEEKTPPRSYLSRALEDVAAVRSAEAGEQAYVEAMEVFYTWMLDSLEEPRRGPDARRVILETLKNLSRQEARDPSLEILGVKPSLIYWKRFAANGLMTDEQITGISEVKIEKLRRTPEQIAEIKAQFPNYAELPAHKMAVALLSAITGIDPQELSDQCPDLGLSGTPGTSLWIPGEGCLEFGTPGEYQLANVLHDTTDFLDQAGVPGINFAVWLDGSSLGSALNSLASAWVGHNYLG